MGIKGRLLALPANKKESIADGSRDTDRLKSHWKCGHYGHALLAGRGDTTATYPPIGICCQDLAARMHAHLVLAL